MDPLSITNASVALAAAVYKCAIEVKRIVGTINDAPDSLCDLAEEAQLIQGALHSVEDALEEDRQAITRYEIEEVFSIAVKGCRATLACIKKEFELLFGRNDWKAQFMVLWKDEDMKKLLGRLDRKRASILLLIQLLTLRSAREIQSLITQNQSSLAVVKEDITALVPAYWSCRETILDSLDKETVDSIYGDRESRLSTTEFDFDYELINTQTYRRALAKAQSKKRSNRRKPSQKEPSPSLQIGMQCQPDTLTRIAEEESQQPVEDLIDLSWDPKVQTPQAPPRAYLELEGLDLAPISVASTEQPIGVREPIALRTTNPASLSSSPWLTGDIHIPSSSPNDGRYHQSQTHYEEHGKSSQHDLQAWLTDISRLSVPPKVEGGMYAISRKPLPLRASDYSHEKSIRVSTDVQGPSILQVERAAREAKQRADREMEDPPSQQNHHSTTKEIGKETDSGSLSSLDTTGGMIGDYLVFGNPDARNHWLAVEPHEEAKLPEDPKAQQRAERKHRPRRRRIKRMDQRTSQVAHKVPSQRDNQPDTEADEPYNDSALRTRNTGIQNPQLLERVEETIRLLIKEQK
ncbi:hypothetical protein FDECE_11659 [Fusarium decemcellulare]|nr:hypothetical protein FDECE_11659 [Fusarium decemcellulare]